MVHRQWENECKSPRLCRQPRNQCSHIRVIISDGWPAGARMPHLEFPFPFSLQGWSQLGDRCPERERATETPSYHLSRKGPTAGGPTVHLLSQAPQLYVRLESWKDVDSGREGICLSRAGQVFFHHLVRSTNLLSTDWIRAQMVGKPVTSEDPLSW